MLNSVGCSGTLSLLSLTFNVFRHFSWDVISATVRHELKRHFDTSRSITFGIVFAMISFGPASPTNSPLSTTSRKEAKLLQNNDQKINIYSSLLHSLNVTKFIWMCIPYFTKSNNVFYVIMIKIHHLPLLDINWFGSNHFYSCLFAFTHNIQFLFNNSSVFIFDATVTLFQRFQEWNSQIYLLWSDKWARSGLSEVKWVSVSENVRLSRTGLGPVLKKTGRNVVDDAPTYLGQTLLCKWYRFR